MRDVYPIDLVRIGSHTLPNQDFWEAVELTKSMAWSGAARRIRTSDLRITNAKLLAFIA
ncbi:MAG: hypothetical protein ACTSWI_07210 [Alphaproteobacteria bacterium]